MKKTAFLYLIRPHLLILFVVLFAIFLPVKTAKAAGPCTPNTTHQGVITADETWCSGGDNVHYITDDVTVQVGVTLTIAAGVTVDSPVSNWSKYLVVQGHLDIVGTPEEPVFLTRSYNYPAQNWGGLFFDGSQGDGSGNINHAIIHHAGANFLPPGCVGLCGNGQTAVFVKDVTNGKQVTINNSTINDNISKGLYIVNSTVNVANTVFSQNQYPIWIEGEESIVAYSGNTFSDNAYPYYDTVNYTIQEDSIVIGSNALMGQDFSLPTQTGLDAYLFFSETTIPFGTTMTVEPGVTLRMVENQYLTVQGRLVAPGTAAQPIHFSGLPSSVQGVDLYWGGLYFDGMAGAGSGNVSYAIIDSGGCNFLPPACTGACGSAQTAVFIKDLPANQVLEIGNSTIQRSLKKGLYVVNSEVAHLDDNLIRGGGIGADFVSNITVRNLALIDQAYDGIIVESGYHFDGSHLTIARAGQSGLHLYSDATGLLQNSILSHNALAVWAEGGSSLSLDTNLSDANTVFQVGAVTAINTIDGLAAFEADGYHIQANSAAVSVGLKGLASIDIDGDERAWPAGTQPDLGADEISAGYFRSFIPLLSR